MKKVFLALALLCGAGTLSFAPASVQAGPILLVSEGKLIGANNVDVLGTLYDVRFADGTCANTCHTVVDGREPHAVSAY